MDRQEAHKLVAVARAVPEWLIAAIGRAPKIGRPRWQEMSELLKAEGAERKARKAADDKAFAHRATDDRFMAVMKALKADAGRAGGLAAERLVARSPEGQEIAKMSLAARSCRIEINRDRDEDFARFVMERLPALYESYKTETPSSDD